MTESIPTPEDFLGNVEPPIWAEVERHAKNNDEFSAALLSIRARVERLEANSKPTPNFAQTRSSETDLSPQAQAVLDALCMEELNGPQQLMACAHAAAALRAAAEHVVSNRVACMELRLVADELEQCNEKPLPAGPFM